MTNGLAEPSSASLTSRPENAPAALSLDADLRDAVMPSDHPERARCEDVSLEDVLFVFNLAKMGLAKSDWRPAFRYVAAYKRVRSFLTATGKLPR